MRLEVRHLPWHPVPWAIALGATFALSRCAHVVRDENPSRAVLRDLSKEGFEAVEQEVAWLTPPRVFGTATAVVRAWKPGEPADIYLVRARVTPGGTMLDRPSVYNLTATLSGDEGAPQLSDGRAAFDVRQDGVATGVRVLDLRGEPLLQGRWPALARMQNALTNLQQTGQLAGVGDAFWSVDPPARIQVAHSDGEVRVQFESATVRLPAAGGDPLDACESLHFQRAPKALPGNLVTWAVDRVRAFPWFGDERMQWLKAVAFSGKDWLMRRQAQLMGDDTAQDVASDLGNIGGNSPPTSYTDPETGWPPKPMELWITKFPVEGEGQWIPLDKDPFVATNPGAPAAFVTSFIRADRERAYTRVYVTMWDPRQVELHMMAGTIEPRGPSGEVGPGMIPRTPEKMKRVVAAFNGGFQALHGEFGMMADGVVYLPPKPYASTVFAMKDGSTGFGTWPKSEEVPDDVLSFRQNLTAVIQDGKHNPYARTWWGGTPPDWEDRVHSTRTGICMTTEGFVAYFYGNEIDEAPLARAMLQARCTYGIHLDMNPGHTGLEFYRAAPTGSLPALERPLQKDWEAEGQIEAMAGWSFRGRRMIRHMGLMNFPRYIQREARDYMYLTLKPVLPGEDLAPVVTPAEADEGKWRTKGLPQHGFPYALAVTTLRPDAGRPGAKVMLIKIDPGTVQVGGDGSAKTVVSFGSAVVTERRPTVWVGDGGASIGLEAPGPGARALVSGVDPESAEGLSASAAIGIQDEDGMLVYAEVQGERRPGQDGAMLRQALGKLGCTTVVMLRKPLAPTFGDEPAAGERVVRLSRVDRAAARVVFPDTPVVGIKEWYPLQAKRVRYFKKPSVAAPSGSEGSEPAAAPAATE